jgi:hypothetical protein
MQSLQNDGCFRAECVIMRRRGFAMEKKLPSVLAAALLAAMFALVNANFAVAQASDTSTAMPKVGEMAPDFKLNYFDGTDLKDVSLSQYRGKKNVVLAFYIFAFTGG